jgi:hypothetical protein
MRALTVALAGAVTIAIVAMPLRGQESGSPRALAGAEFYNVSFGAGVGTKSVRELVVPLGFTVPIARRLVLDAGTYYVNAKRTDQAGGSGTVTGLTDLVVRGALQIVPDVAALTVSVNVPTGKQTLSGDQLLVAGAVATDLIPFPVTSFGSGVSVTTSLAYALPVGPWALGVAGSYRYNGSYQPLADTTADLKPGGEVRLRMGVDRLVGQGRLTMGFTFSTFARDEFGSDQLGAGRRYISQASWNIPVGNSSLAFYAWDVHRMNDAFGPDTLRTPKLAANTVAIGLIAGLRVGRSVLRPALEVRHAWQGTTTMASAGTIVGVGVRFQWNLGGGFAVLPGVRMDLGSLPKAAGGSASVTGVSAGLSVRAAL